jgi:HK97 family phage major capsid protein
MNAEQQAVIDVIKKDREATEKRLNDLQQLADQHAESIGNLIVGGSGSRDVSGSDSERLAVFNALLLDRHGADAPQLNAIGLQAYQNAMGKYLRFGQAALDSQEYRAALSVGSDPAGGYTVLPTTDPVPRERLFRTSPMRAVASQQTITMGGSFEFPVDVGDFGSGWVGELEARPETDDSSFAFHTIYAREVYALVPITQRLLDDSAIDIGAYVERKLGGKFTRAENAGFVSGDGIARPRGFLDHDISTDGDTSRTWGEVQYIATGASADFPTLSGMSHAKDFAALYDAKAALHAELRSGAVWSMNSTTLAFLEKKVDQDGRSIIRPSMDAATPERLLGHDIVIMEDMPDIASNSLSIAFANFAEGYQIVDKPGIRVLRDPYTTKGKVKVYAYKRVGGDISNFDAIKLIRFSAS